MSPQMQRKISLKRKAVIIYVLAGLVIVFTLFIYPVGYAFLFIAPALFLWGALTSRRSDEIPVDEPAEEEQNGYPNISLRTYSEKRRSSY